MVLSLIEVSVLPGTLETLPLGEKPCERQVALPDNQVG